MKAVSNQRVIDLPQLPAEFQLDSESSNEEESDSSLGEDGDESVSDSDSSSSSDLSNPLVDEVMSNHDDEERESSAKDKDSGGSNYDNMHNLKNKIKQIPSPRAIFKSNPLLDEKNSSTKKKGSFGAKKDSSGKSSSFELPLGMMAARRRENLLDVGLFSQYNRPPEEERKETPASALKQFNDRNRDHDEWAQHFI